MSAVLGKAGKKLFEKHLEKYSPADPLYEEYTTDNGKRKKRKRMLPPGLSKRDAKILKKLMKRAHHLDKGFSILGLRFGWTFLIGLIPVVGDFTDAALSYMLIIQPAKDLEIPQWLLRRLLINNAASTAIGTVPFLGDVFVGAFKANSRNVALIEEFLRIRGEEFLKMGNVVEDDTGDRGWLGFSREKKNHKSLPKTELNANDVEQIKPGAGMSGGEMKESIEPGIVGHSEAVGGRSGSASNSHPSKSGSSGFSMFGSKSRKSKNTATTPVSTAPGEQGRFVEDVGPIPGSLAASPAK